jgi:hypothetical protein
MKQKLKTQQKTKTRKRTREKDVTMPNPNLKLPLKTQERHPRPEGLTMMLREAHREKSKGKLKGARNMIVQYWQRSNFEWFGEPISLDELSRLIDQSPLKTIEEMTKAVRYLMVNGKGAELGIGMAAAAHGFFGALQARYFRHLKAIEGSLLDASGDLSYKPFKTETALRTLDGLLSTGKAQLEVAKFFKPDKPAAIVNQQANFGGAPTDPKASESGRYLGPTEAVRLLEAEGRANILDNEALAGRALEEHASTLLPEIIATKQQGIDMNGIDVAKPKKQKRTHTDRREDEGYIYTEVIIP